MGIILSEPQDARLTVPIFCVAAAAAAGNCDSVIFFSCFVRFLIAFFLLAFSLCSAVSHHPPQSRWRIPNGRRVEFWRIWGMRKMRYWMDESHTRLTHNGNKKERTVKDGKSNSGSREQVNNFDTIETEENTKLIGGRASRWEWNVNLLPDGKLLAFAVKVDMLTEKIFSHEHRKMFSFLHSTQSSFESFSDFDSNRSIKLLIVFFSFSSSRAGDTVGKVEFLCAVIVKGTAEENTMKTFLSFFFFLFLLFFCCYFTLPCRRWFFVVVHFSSFGAPWRLWERAEELWNSITQKYCKILIKFSSGARGAIRVQARWRTSAFSSFFVSRELWMKKNFSSIKLNFLRLFADSNGSLLCSLLRGQIDPTIKLNERNSILIETFSLTVMKTFFALFSLIRFAYSLETTTQHSTAQFSTRPLPFGWMNRSGELCGSKLQVPQHTALELGTRSEGNYWNETFSSSLRSVCDFGWLKSFSSIISAGRAVLSRTNSDSLSLMRM